jgi:4'-phosphopantetheinyl transferase
MQYTYHAMTPYSTDIQDIDALRSQHHVWYIQPDRVTTPAQLAACRALLSADEAQRQGRFLFAEDRHRYLVSHAMLRETLSRYWPIAPQRWTFSHGEHGKPEIANAGAPPIRFNLTHTRGLAACIISLETCCGIDAECLDARHNPLAVARRMFSAEENARLLQLTGRERLEFFYTCWTLREAYVKARGVGISFPTRRLRFRIAGPEPISVHFDEQLNDTAARWQFQLFRPTRDHVLATANCSVSDQTREVVARCYRFSSD